MNVVDKARRMKGFYPIFEIVERFKIKFLHNKNEDPIIIYQMGKVGSSTIYQTLKKLKLKNSMYHVHILSDQNLDEAIDRYRGYNSYMALLRLNE